MSRLDAIRHLQEVFQRTLINIELSEEEKKRIHVLCTLIVDYSQLDDVAIGQIHEAYMETVD